MAREAGFSEERVFDILVVSSEAIANAIEHAPQKGRVRVTAILFPDRLEVRVEGPGEFQTPNRLEEGTEAGARVAAHGAAGGSHGPVLRARRAVRWWSSRSCAQGPSEGSGQEPLLRSLARVQMLLDAAFEQARSPLVLLDRDFNFVRVNQAYARACHRPIEDFAGRNHFEMYPSDTQVLFEEVIRTKRPMTVEARAFLFPDHPEWGVTYWDWTLSPVLDAAGEVDALLFALQEVPQGHRRNVSRTGPAALVVGRAARPAPESPYRRS